MREKGYYRYATVHGDSIIFACEDDLWHVSNKGGLARRLTTGPTPNRAPTVQRRYALALAGVSRRAATSNSWSATIFLWPRLHGCGT